jgi:hypothetical protein
MGCSAYEVPAAGARHLPATKTAGGIWWIDPVRKQIDY